MAKIKLQVKIKREIYCNDEGNFKVYVGTIPYKHDNSMEEEISITYQGLDELRPGPGKTTLVGEWRQYRGQDSFKADYEEFDNTSYENKLNLLCSIDGIKEKKAKNILDNIENADIEIFYNKEVPKIHGIGKKTIEKIHQGLNFLRNNKKLKELIECLGNQISITKIHKLHEILVNRNLEVSEFKNDPYYLLIDDIGLKFNKVDQLAINKFGCNKHLKSRILFLTEKIVETITKFGDTYTNQETFNSKIQDLSLNADNVNEYIDDENSRVCIENDNLQTKSLHKSEKSIPEYLKILNENESCLSQFEIDNINNLIKEYEKKNEIILHEKQRDAVFESVTNNCSIICGGAGTGKSTIIKCVIYVLKKLRFNIVQTAPTGKASRRMEQATNYESNTCHRFYMAEEVARLGGQYPEWSSNKQSTLIIDEFSMVDSILFYNILFNMFESNTNYNKLILVGDDGQLPSVGAGNVMNDIIKSNKIKLIELTNTFRQSENSNILTIAKKVRNNETFSQLKEKDFFVNFPKDLDGYILRCWSKKYQEYKVENDIKNLDSLYDEFQLCTSNRKRANYLNDLISQEMKIVKFKLGKKNIEFGLNDKIMCVKNDYFNNVYNGEFGRIISLSHRTGLAEYEEDILIDNSNELKKLYQKENLFLKNAKFQVYYKGLNKIVSYDLAPEELQNFSLAYVCTIHKLQGSEFKTVICDVSEFNMITDSRLLYTSITRAKQQFILLSKDMDTINKIVKNKTSSKRNTLLKDKINDYFEKQEQKKENVSNE